MITYYATGLIIALYFTVLPAILFNVQLNSDDIRLLVSGILGVVLGRFNGRSADQSGTKYKLQQETENGTGKILT